MRGTPLVFFFQWVVFYIDFIWWGCSLVVFMCELANYLSLISLALVEDPPTLLCITSNPSTFLIFAPHTFSPDLSNLHFTGVIASTMRNTQWATIKKKHRKFTLNLFTPVLPSWMEILFKKNSEHIWVKNCVTHTLPSQSRFVIKSVKTTMEQTAPHYLVWRVAQPRFSKFRKTSQVWS